MRKSVRRARRPAGLIAPGFRLARLTIDRLDAESGLIKVEVLLARPDLVTDTLIAKIADAKADDLSYWDRSSRQTVFTKVKKLSALLQPDGPAEDGEKLELAENMVFMHIEPGASERFAAGKTYNATSVARQLAKTLYKDASRVAGQ